MSAAGFAQLLEETLSVEYASGRVTPLDCPYTTEWRTLPYAMVAQWQGGEMRYERAGERPINAPAGAVLLSPSDARHCVTSPPSGTGDLPVGALASLALRGARFAAAGAGAAGADRGRRPSSSAISARRWRRRPKRRSCLR